MQVLDSRLAAAFDAYLIDQVGFDQRVLMENAARGVLRVALERFEVCSGAGPTDLLVLAGPGHNGADAVAIARLLCERYDQSQARVRLAVLASPPLEQSDRASGVETPAWPQMSHATGEQLRLLERQGSARPANLELLVGGSLERQLEFCLPSSRPPKLMFDGLFGVGLNRPLAGSYGRLVSQLDQAVPRAATRRVAIDLPSGLQGSSWRREGPVLDADLTVTFIAPKIAHVLAPAAFDCGEVAVVDLGAERSLLARFFASSAQAGTLDPLHVEWSIPGGTDSVCRPRSPFRLRRRAEQSHKGSYGHVVVAGGSPGKTGAVVLAVRAALRAGAGLVTAAVAEPWLQILELASFESMTLGLSEQEGGLSGSAADQLLARIDEIGPGAILVLGPGLGRAAGSREFLRQVATEAVCPMVIDADGLNLLVDDMVDNTAGNSSTSGAPDLLAKLAERQAATVLTPHPGEMARLLGLEDASAVQADRWSAVRSLARRTGAVVVLKGHRSLISSPAGEVFVNTAGSPGMATGGTGDVLAGLCGALLASEHLLMPSETSSSPMAAQEGAPAGLAATRLAVWLHSRAGDLACDRLGETSLLASDLLKELPAAIRESSR